MLIPGLIGSVDFTHRRSVNEVLALVQMGGSQASEARFVGGFRQVRQDAASGKSLTSLYLYFPYVTFGTYRIVTPLAFLYHRAVPDDG